MYAEELSNRLLGFQLLVKITTNNKYVSWPTWSHEIEANALNGIWKLQLSAIDSRFNYRQLTGALLINHQMQNFDELKRRNGKVRFLYRCPSSLKENLQFSMRVLMAHKVIFVNISKRAQSLLSDEAHAYGFHAELPSNRNGSWSFLMDGGNETIEGE